MTAAGLIAIGRATGLIAVLALLLLPHWLGNYGVYLLALWAVYAIAAMGLNLTLGYAGQVSLAQAAFVGIGAYTTALLTVKAGLDFWLTLPVSAAIGFGLGVLLGIPALRVRHHYLAFVTLGFNQLVFLVLRNEEWLTGGTYGVVGISRPDLLGWRFDDPIAFYYLCLGALAVVGAVLLGLLRSPWGRAFAALRENPLRAASLGIDVRTYTLLAFAIGSALGALAGSFYAPLVEFIDPTPFTLSTSLALLLMVVVGGAGHFTGPLIGAGLVTLLPQWMRIAEDYYLMIYALLVILLLAVCPQGLAGLWVRLRLRWAGPRGAGPRVAA